MRKVFRIAARDYNASVRTKGFVIGLIIAPIFMCGSLIAFALFKDRVDTADRHIAVIDRSGAGAAEHLVAEAEKRNASDIFDEETKKKIKPAYVIEIHEPDAEEPMAQRLDFSDQVRSKKLLAFVEIGESVLNPGADPLATYINYYSENSALSDERDWVQSVINPYLRLKRGTAAGLEEETVREVISWIYVTGLGLVSVDGDSGEVKEAERSNELEAILVPVIMTMMLFMMMMMGAMPLVGTVQEEKGQRISEVLLGSIRPFGLMMGKVLGGVAVSLTGIMVYVIIGYAAAEYFEVKDKIPFDLLPWFFFYMTAAIFMFGSLYAAVGSACNDQKEVQSIMPFVMIPMLVPMFVIMPVIKEPLGGLATGLSLIPPFTPMTMMLRQASPTTIPAWQPWVGMIGVALFTLFCIWAGARIFRIGILMQGKAPKVGELVKWVFKG